MKPGDVMSVAAWIERECKLRGASESDRLWAHEAHGKCRAAGGDDDEIRAAVRAFLDQRCPLRRPEPR